MQNRNGEIKFVLEGPDKDGTYYAGFTMLNPEQSIGVYSKDISHAVRGAAVALSELLLLPPGSRQRELRTPPSGAVLDLSDAPHQQN